MTETPALEHPRSIGWAASSALALGGSNQSLILLATLLVGEHAIPGQGTAAILLLGIGLLLAWLAAPGWLELVLLSPNRTGGVAAACTNAFRPYSLLLSALAGGCYWWGWMPVSAITATIAASAIHQWIFPTVPVIPLAATLIGICFAIALGGMRVVARVALPLASIATALAFVSAFVPIVVGHVDWHSATDFHLVTPFAGWFGNLTSVMAGLYLVGFVAPAFEASLCHVGEMRDPARAAPRALLASAATAGLYFVVLPIIWLGVIGPGGVAADLAEVLGPTYAPIFGASAKALAIGFLCFNMFAGTLQPLAGASRTLAQLADDGIFPRALGRRSKRDVPWVATAVTAAASIALLFASDQMSWVAAANFAYLLAIGLPSVAVWLLRRDSPELERPFRAPRGTLALGVAAAVVWGISAVFGFEQFGLPTVILGLILTYTGAALYAWRKFEDRRFVSERGVPRSLHMALTAAMIAVLALDGLGYYSAIRLLRDADAAAIAALQDIFVLVALLTIAVGVILPGLIADAATRGLATANATLREGTVALQQEIGERRFAERRLRHVALHDDLTGLANRALFMERFATWLAGTSESRKTKAAVLFLDLDRFKLVNDSLGHLAGDQFLMAVAKRLEACLRAGDTLARLGGDEFTFLLTDIESTTDATTFAASVLERLVPSFTIGGREISASASIGIALTQAGGDAPEDVLRNADIAMYRAKELGKHRYELFVPELLAKAVSLLQLENDLKRAFERREFVLLYQPIVSLASGELRGFEALIRWNHPERGIIAPDHFIPAAEESGLIVDIGAWVIFEACRQAGLWRKTFATETPLSIGINVSAKQFLTGDLIVHIRQGLRTNHLDGRHVHVEVTESAIMSDPENATAILRELRRIGIRVHLDDFGTGYSSLGYLQRFPVDTLKIDRSFISMSGSSVGNPEIVRAITTLARSLSMTTTAEGVETMEQLDRLRALGCTDAQGYLFARPLDVAAANDLISLRLSLHSFDAFIVENVG